MLCNLSVAFLFLGCSVILAQLSDPLWFQATLSITSQESETEAQLGSQMERLDHLVYIATTSG